MAILTALALLGFTAATEVAIHVDSMPFLTCTIPALLHAILTNGPIYQMEIRMSSPSLSHLYLAMLQTTPIICGSQPACYGRIPTITTDLQLVDAVINRAVA